MAMDSLLPFAALTTSEEGIYQNSAPSWRRKNGDLKVR